MKANVEIKGYEDFIPKEFLSTLAEGQMYDLFDYIAQKHQSQMLELIEVNNG
jgi:hypothetical protein